MTEARLITLVKTLTPLQALHRVAVLNEWLYSQTITFNRTTWEPKPSPKSKLFAWYFLSFLVIVMLANNYYIVLGELMSPRKDPDLSVVMYVILLICFTAYMVSTTVFFSYYCYSDELCFVLSNVCKFEGN